MSAKEVKRKANVYYKDDLAGALSETDSGYIFQYNNDFIKGEIPISLSLPIQEEPFESEKLFPFFKCLLPEGWYLDIVSKKQKIPSEDLFGVLISTSSIDTIGAVTLRKDDQNG